MLFKDLKSGFPVYIYDRTAIEVKLGKVSQVSAPHLDKGQFDMMANMVVDVAIDVDGVTKTYTFKDNSETGYTGSLVITTEKQNIIREIEASKQQSEEALSLVDMHRSRVEKYEAILAEYNPAIKEKKAIDERFGKLEGSMDELKVMLQNLIQSKAV